jgi:type VI secretion system protein ImpH
MATQDRTETAALKRELLKGARSYSFFQVLRLIERMDPDGTVRIRPDLSFAFPASDIEQVRELVEQEDGERGFEVTATFLGLYGSSSPLPNFYTEELFDEALEESSVKRDFLDIFNQRLYELLYQIWLKYQLAIEVAEKGSKAHLEKLFCLLGLGNLQDTGGLLGPEILIKYVGLLTQWPRSAAGLEAILRDLLGLETLRVVPCIERRVSIPKDQRCCLGENACSLGSDSIIGSETRDLQGKFRIEVGPVDRETFFSLSPGGSKERLMREQVAFYLNVPLEYETRITMDGSQVKSTQLGSDSWSHLGMDTWIYSGDRLRHDITVTFN